MYLYTIGVNAHIRRPTHTLPLLVRDSIKKASIEGTVPLVPNVFLCLSCIKIVEFEFTIVERSHCLTDERSPCAIAPLLKSMQIRQQP
jgi:hypothetical protein